MWLNLILTVQDGCLTPCGIEWFWGDAMGEIKVAVQMYHYIKKEVFLKFKCQFIICHKFVY